MSKKDKKIEIQLIDHKVMVNQTKIDGYQLQIGKRVVGEIAELDEKFAVLKNDTVDSFFKTLEQAVENIIENYNLNH
ncbi:branched-chain amino acid aminotransferase [Streptococcus dysgalactiae subsp. dysgalactiae]|uniref:Branched-chain amino acid aminotransferase n=1 Tax=Streptococcus dysgalactiae subsp. dysgalactiae TaxID=99822 RepID=A0A380JUP0_STRDY|nr:DUF2969 domain-containing protein [Streptococcus dysgalactiae]MCB2833970.1 DUF2969 domain-containing protein [Streptococcus dysgalactiae subsp. dysgalactiae]MCB2841774.1 DUF2969 domain-containing protein [Streptococcus dysgalactiae subsp. dysgalactiae]MCB2845572.1 DUF2969 domain-containing protein [Streptococcus dysgalactiae subsp. dysgalactiae]QZT26356.1 DUF2969 domain-containing protein [Streptococcus dysgalactiae]SUN49614.1 branched-chain amino acid aminotransferase [Streptococcus dysgal